MGLGDIIEKAVCLGLALTHYLGGQAGCKCTISDETFPTALTNQGAVRGFEDANGNFVFLGIPYAATTGGSNRYVVFRFL
jgi:hypothetical protein